MINSLKNQFEGFLKTPPLWHNSEIFELKQFDFPEISIPAHPEILENIPQLSTKFVLGKRIELYFAFAVKLSGKYKILAENIQISQNKITLGEIDFIIEDLNTGEQIHIEVVYKFYVYDPAFENEMRRWIGPNRRDNLLRKVKKLKEHQFPMLFNPATGKALKNININSPYLKQQVCFKAQLFVPKNLNYADFHYLNKNCISGYWITYEAFNTEEYFNFRYFAPKKQDWPVQPENNEIWYSFDQIRVQIQELFSNKRSPLIWMKKNAMEFEKFFVVWW